MKTTQGNSLFSILYEYMLYIIVTNDHEWICKMQSGYIYNIDE